MEKMNRTGLYLDTIIKGLDRVKFDGGITVPNQGENITPDTPKLRRAVDANPGAVIIDFLPIIGSDPHAKSYATLYKQGGNLWQTVRSATPHAEKYQPGDLMTCVNITACLKPALADVERKIKSFYWESKTDQYASDGYWRMLVNATNNEERRDYIGKIPEWVNRYNGVVRDIGAKQIPDCFPIYHRWADMARVAYRDHKNEDEAQLIFFRPSHIYDFQARPEEDPGMDLVPQALPFDIESELTLIENVTKHIIEDSAFSGMFADLVLAFPEKECLKWDPFPLDYEHENKIPSIYDINVLMAIHNATVVRVNAPTWKVLPKTGNIEGQIALGYGSYDLGMKPPICNSVLDDKIDVKHVLNLYQWVVCDSKAVYDTSSALVSIINPPTEILTGMKIYHYHWGLNDGRRVLSASPTLVNANTVFAWSAYDDAGQNMYTYGYMKWKSALATFAWAPIYRERYVRMEQNASVDTTTPDNMVEEVIIGENAELEAPFLADPIQVIGAHDVARVGLWNIPISVINGKRNGNK